MPRLLQDDERLSEDSTIFLLRTLLMLACEPGTLGAMSVGPSNIDPAFWVRVSPVAVLYRRLVKVTLKEAKLLPRVSTIGVAKKGACREHLGVWRAASASGASR